MTLQSSFELRRTGTFPQGEAEKDEVENKGDPPQHQSPFPEELPELFPLPCAKGPGKKKIARKQQNTPRKKEEKPLLRTEGEPSRDKRFRITPPAVQTDVGVENRQRRAAAEKSRPESEERRDHPQERAETARLPQGRAPEPEAVQKEDHGKEPDPQRRKIPVSRDVASPCQEHYPVAEENERKQQIRSDGPQSPREKGGPRRGVGEKQFLQQRFHSGPPFKDIRNSFQILHPVKVYHIPRHFARAKFKKKKIDFRGKVLFFLPSVFTSAQ